MRFTKTLSLLLFSVLSGVFSQNIFASAFQSFETSGSGLGNAYAGAAAAAADDVAYEFDNPAGITRIKHPEMALSGVAAIVHSSFTVDHVTPLSPMSVLLGKNTASPMGTNYLPAFHFATPIINRLFFGFGVTVPFGYFTEYPDDSVASSFATKSRIMTINLNPSLAYQFNDNFSIGVGFDAEYLKADLNRYVNMQIPILKSSYQNRITNSADGWGYGWNIGLLYQFNPGTRIGLAYRSKIDNSIAGNGNGHEVRISPLSPAPLIANKNWDVKSTINLPDMVTLSMYHDFTQSLAGMASVIYTRWDCFDYLTLKFSGSEAPSSGISIHEAFHDSFRYSLGLNYRINDQWLLRFGTAYDQSPVSNQYRTIELPDADRVWLTTGVKYTLNDYFSADLGYAHVFIMNGSVNQSDPAIGNIVGHYDHNYANLVGLQVNVKLANI
ncbi:MAG: OmpP1/FadL family transporter [Gammaproteobacteria bacterium]|nr:OmpP1/FadL family transporter [Gammaproteobacteria bacterium]